MINTRELRLSNWVYDGETSRFPMQVETISRDYVYLDFEGNEGDVFECEPEDMVPIPISKNLIRNLNQIINSVEPPFFIHMIEFDFVNGKFILSVNNRQYHIGSPIIYVHELQNLVFDLTKEELEIKREWL